MTLGIDATVKVHVPILIHLNDTHCNFHVYMIFVSIVQISAEASNPSVTEFKQFMETLKSNIEKAENNRTVHHLRYVLLFTLSVLAWSFFFRKTLCNTDVIRQSTILIYEISSGFITVNFL